MNTLYQQMNNNGFMARFSQFKQMFKGDPQQQVQQLLNSGRISQEQYNAAVQKANTLAKMMGM
jgi:hypothetical protein